MRWRAQKRTDGIGTLAWLHSNVTKILIHAGGICTSASGQRHRPIQAGLISVGITYPASFARKLAGVRANLSSLAEMLSEPVVLRRNDCPTSESAIPKSLGFKPLAPKQLRVYAPVQTARPPPPLVTGVCAPGTNMHVA